MGRNKSSLKIRNTMILLFLLAMLVSIFGIGHMVFSSWFVAAGNTTERIAATLNERIHDEIYSFLHEPEHINEMYYTMIQNKVVDLTNEHARNRFFVGVLNAHDDDIYSFSFGTVNGEYYGARRNASGVIEIMKNDAETGGESWYYSLNEDWTAGSRVLQAGKFDPRTRAWYEAAMEADGPAFSPVYKHFIMDDLCISAARPVYNNDGELQGVLGTHMLLSGIGEYITDVIQDYNGYSVIIEKSTGAIIANSMGMDNFDVLSDGTLKRHHILDLGGSDIIGAYEQFTEDQQPQFLYHGKESQHINVRELNMGGLDWVIVSAIPTEQFLSSATSTMRLAMLLSAAALLLSFVLYYVMIRRLTQPVYYLLRTTEALSSGDLSQRAPVIRNDEIGRISVDINKVADKMQYMIENLEATVHERTEKLYRSNQLLTEKKEQLQLILDSAGEGIYGYDTEGNCTFCNTSAVKILGYSKEEDLLGKNMHELIHHSTRDGKPFPADQCRILKSTREGKGVYVDDEVFWKADGTYIDVEYRSYPQMIDGEIVGSVITFTDITDRRKREEKINYLSYHDTLTGLYNRQYFTESLAKLDRAENLPLSVIFADINGLKMTNDIFGHAAGDALIKKSSEILVQSCRASDMVARVGGDEFIILLPNTEHEQVKRIITRIRSGFAKIKVEAIKCSLSIGSDTKSKVHEPIEDIIANAENEMYWDKLMHRKEVNRDMIDTIIDTLHSENPEEKQHSEVVSQLCGEMGAAFGMADPEISRLKQAGYLHDIGKIVLDKSSLAEDVDKENMKQHVIGGYRILHLFDDTLDLAEYVYNHHERWDGKGYPKGLKGEEIPKISRIISIAETYERVLRREGGSEGKKKALQVIQDGAGKRFDPQIAELFIQMMEANNE